jgi:triacylglycerol lipase
MPAKLQVPIVLVHGLFGFDRLRLAGWTVLSYFPRIPEYLSEAGNRVLVPSLPPMSGIAERAAQLKAFLDRESPREPVHLIGHSMGGLDCRYLVTKLGMAERVLSLTTIATPHHGSPFADWGTHRLGRVVRPVMEFFSLPFQAFYDLTTASCRRFNEDVPNVPGVRYFSVAGKFEGDWFNPEWQLSHKIVSAAEGDNDGVVSVRSATYGETCEIWDGDHLSLVNWPNPALQARGRWYDRTEQYGKLVGRLKDEGF